METIFSIVWRISLSAGYLILAITAARILLKKAPRTVFCLLWLLAGLRLVITVPVESTFSLAPDIEALEARIFSQDSQSPANTAKETGMNEAVPSALQDNRGDVGETAARPAADGRMLQRFLYVCSRVWVAGMLVMTGYFVWSLLTLKRKLRMAVPEDINGSRVYRCWEISSPFLLGIFHPRIYITGNIKEEEMFYILTHERMHLRRKDHLLKLGWYFILTLHWFNPLVWMAYVLMCRDIELACDEGVIRELGLMSKKAYAMALLTNSAPKRSIAACPIAFGETGVKRRIRNIHDYTKPTVWWIMAGIAVFTVIFLCFVTQRAEAPNGGAAAGTSLDAAGVGDDAFARREAFLEDWATAFCDRDGEAILSMSAPEWLEEQGLLIREGDEVSFGFSSPWPMMTGHDYQIQRVGENSAQILYYAWVSDPHITVWVQNLEFRREGGSFLVTHGELLFMDSIDTTQEYKMAYPDGITSESGMNYLRDDMGKYLNDNALANKDYVFYSMLFQPEDAARYLLNITNEPGKVETSVTYTGSAEGSKALVGITFLEDGGEVSVTMIQPYGTDGIWIPEPVGEG